MLYFAHGLRLESSLPLPGLPQASGIADVVVREGRVQDRARHTLPVGCYPVDASHIFYSLPGVGVFLAREGRELLLELEADADDRMVRSAILGQAMACILHQRGTLALHASAVEIDERSVAFVGERGDGKSTTATAFVQRGHRLLTDDVLAVEVNDGRAVAHSAAGWVKLRTDAATTLAPASDLPVLRGPEQKRFWDVGWTPGMNSLPFAGLFVLSAGPRVQIERLLPHAAFSVVATHTYVRELVMSAQVQALYLPMTAAFVRAVPVFRLSRPKQLSSLEAVTDAVRRQVAKSGRRG